MKPDGGGHHLQHCGICSWHRQWFKPYQICLWETFLSGLLLFMHFTGILYYLLICRLSRISGRNLGGEIRVGVERFLVWIHACRDFIFLSIYCPIPPVVCLSPPSSYYTSLTHIWYMPSGWVWFHLLFLIFKVLTRVYSSDNASVSRPFVEWLKMDHKSFSCNPNINYSYSSFGLILTSCSPKEICNESGWQLWSGSCDYFGWICQISVENIYGPAGCLFSNSALSGLLQWFSLCLIYALLLFEIILAVSSVCAPVIDAVSSPVTSSSTSQIIFSFPPSLIV